MTDEVVIVPRPSALQKELWRVTLRREVAVSKTTHWSSL